MTAQSSSRRGHNFTMLESALQIVVVSRIWGMISLAT